MIQIFNNIRLYGFKTNFFRNKCKNLYYLFNTTSPILPNLTSFYILNISRWSKILRWIPNSDKEKEMIAIKDTPSFLKYFLSQKDLSHKEKMAALTILTTRKKLDFFDPLFKEFNNRILSDFEFLDSKFEYVIHRYGILGHNQSLWILSEMFKDKIFLMKPKQLSLSSWSFVKNGVNKIELWDLIGKYTMENLENFNFFDISLVLWCFRKIIRKYPQELFKIKNRILELLQSNSNNSNFLSTVDNIQLQNQNSFKNSLNVSNDCQNPNLHDLCTIIKSFSIMTPHDKNFLLFLFNYLIYIKKEYSLEFTAQGLTSLWTSLSFSMLDNSFLIEELCEESRNLRLDHTFNSSMVISIAESLLKLQITDARVVYQIVHWIDKNGLKLYSNQLYTLINILFNHKIFHKGAWKRMGVCLTKVGIDLSMNEIKNCIDIFKRAEMGNERLYSILNFYLKEKEDILNYGPR